MTNDIVETVQARAFITAAGETIRRSAKLSLSDVADALDVSKSTVLRWERGDRTPGADHATAYADLLKRIAAT